MKIVIFAHTPPPHHGQSFMVKLMLEGFGGDARRVRPQEGQPLVCYHVNSRVSESLADIGSTGPGKVLRLAGFCLQAIWLRLRHGARTLYYVPAPGKRSALYRDWMVMALCRPFFKNLVLHWHAVGLNRWLETERTWPERWLTRLLLGRPALSIVLANAGAESARWLGSRRVEIVPNGIPDPCPGFDETVRRRRAARPGSRGPFQLLYLSLCTRVKGLFATLEGVALYNSRRPEGERIRLTVAGDFVDAAEEREYRERVARPDLAGWVCHAGYAHGDAKRRLFEESDGLCFLPALYPPESFGLVVLEAMAFGLPLVASRGNAIPEILGPDYPGLADPQAPGEVAGALEWLVNTDCGPNLRAQFLARFSIERHLRRLAEVIQTVG